MPAYPKSPVDLSDLRLILDRLPAAVSVIDLDGALLYYNENATRFVDRKPEYLGRDVREYHQLESSRKRIQEIIQGFKAGNREPVQYVAFPRGEPLSVTVVPLLVDGALVGCIHHVVKKD
jgi:DUF438 domain-containing protein